MTFFTRFTTTALAAVTAFAAVGVAHAHHTPRRPYSVSESAALVRVAKDLGVEFFTEDSSASAAEACESGAYGYATSNHQLLLCVKNHDGDGVEFGDTIRHELIHIAQYCKARKTGGADAQVLFPAQSDDFIGYAQEALHWNILGYETADWGNEAEARTLAHLLDERQVATLLTRYCK